MTLYLKIASGGDISYPYSAARLRADNPDTSFADVLPDERLADWGVYPVEQVDPPTPSMSQALREGEPELIEGAWRQTWTLADREMNEVRAEMHAAVTAKRDAILRAGWAHDFGAVGTHTLDLRHADDKANWHLLLNKTDKMIAAGAGAAPIRIRTAADTTIIVTAAEANAAMIAFLAWGEGVLSHKWSLDDEIDAAGDFDQLGAIDLEAGWPS